jgi:peptidoglycan/LPS O-acetylase OafA/YrhL
MHYRRDIDGLRALAVLPVVIFHIAQSYAPGGYVGVDIFFVISGYLISGNIFREIEQGKFKFSSFYERRIRRIAPAYLAMVFFTTAIVAWKFYPHQTSVYAASMFASILSYTNLHFWATLGYFTQSAEETPLLHTWSLSVEEQFYLVFPIIAIILFRKKWVSLNTALISLAAVSFVVSAAGAFIFPTATFYFLPTRAWELLVGSLLAAQVMPPLKLSWQRNAIAFGGLLAICASMIFYDKSTPFPGIAALPPCLGAAMIIYAGQSGNNIVGRMLSLSPVVFIGLISYSLYLWHWPLMVLQRTSFLLTESDSKLVVRLTVLAASLAAATLSWLLIERPTRNRSKISSKTMVWSSAFVVMIALSISLTLYLTGGLPQRFNPKAVQMAAFAGQDHDAQFRTGQCFLSFEEQVSVFDTKACLPNLPGRSNIMLVGDSHSAMLYSGMKQAFADRNVLQVTGVECVALLPEQPKRGFGCVGLLKIALDEVAKARGELTILLSSRWNQGGLSATNGLNRWWMDDLATTVRTFEATGAKVFVIGPMPEYKFPLPELIADGIQKNDPLIPNRMLSNQSFLLDAAMRDFAAKEKLSYISLKDVVCPQDNCTLFAAPDVPLLFDKSHLGEAGSDFVSSAIAKRIESDF